MTEFSIQARLSQLCQLGQRRDSQRQELARCQAEIDQLGPTIQAWDAQITWAEGKTLPRQELLRRQARLEDLTRQWDASLSPDRPDWQLRALQESLREARQRLEALRAVERLVSRVEELARRWQVVQATGALLARLAEARQELDDLRHTDVDLVAAWQRRCELQEQVQARQAARDGVIAMARQLGQALPGAPAEDWADLALRDINRLSQEAGGGLARLKKEVQGSQRQAQASGDQVAARESALQPMRERVAVLEAQEQQARQSLAGESAELAQWGQELTLLGLPMVDGDSQPELEAFLKRLQAEHKELQWFQDTADG